MDFGFTVEQEKLRKEVREFFLSEMPCDLEAGPAGAVEGYSPVSAELQTFWKELQEKASKRGYLTPGWSKEYGGLGFSPIEQGILNEEEQRVGITWLGSMGLQWVAPAIILFGTEEQKKRFIPPIARGEISCFQAFSEPEAGSETANVQLRAVEEGDYYVLNGQKTFISGVVEPDYLYTLVRTADVTPKHRGLSLFLVPANLPGITYQPLVGLGGGIHSDIFFDDVRVSKEYLLGELNRGFYHAMATFEFERSNAGMPAGQLRVFRNFVQFCKEEKRQGRRLFNDPYIRETLARIATEHEVFRLIAWHAVWWFSQKEKLGPKPYDLTTLYRKLLPIKHSHTLMNILGTYGQLKRGSKGAIIAGYLEKWWLANRSRHGGGTLEIAKNIIALRGLGLPR